MGIKNFTVFVSGGGSNFASIQDTLLKEKPPGRINLLISSNPEAYAIERAKNYNIDYIVIQLKDHKNPENFSDTLLQKLEEYNTDYILLAGYLKMIPLKLIRNYKNKIVNIHPALLPKFGGNGMYGIHVHEAVIAAGEKESGPTVHFVDELYDTGPIIMQSTVPVYPADTPRELQKRVLEQEHIIYPKVVQLLCEDKIKVGDNKIIIDS